MYLLMTGAAPLTLTPLMGIPLIGEGDDVAGLVGDAIEGAGIAPAAFDVVVVTQKIVSKAEGRRVRLADVVPSAHAVELAASLDKDPRMIEVVFGESNAVVASGHGVLIAEHRSGHVMANAGVDRSNVGHSDDNEEVLLLPRDPDASAAALHRALEVRFGCRLAVIVSDSVGRAWRNGVAGIAIGAAGLPALTDLRGAPDLFGVPLKVTLTGFADQIAAAANLVAGEGAEGVPAVHVRGLRWSAAPLPARALVRDRESDLFR
ncbi:MAG: coenzyme F420-0:L-glutamate ligase [Thiotrichales bacterium]|nr:coenzyme F420-0:L-glutamate ligase [Thiotrichales bacterium]